MPWSAALGVPGLLMVMLAPPAEPVQIERRLGLMGTSLAITVTAADRPTALAASERAVRALEAAAARLSTWRDDTELARLNRAPVGERVVLSPELAANLAAAGFWWRETDGAFDPGIGALVDAWGLRHGGRMPTAAERQEAMACGGLAALQLEGQTAARLHPGLRIEEGGFGKGAGLDEAIAALKAAGALGAVLNLGGQVAVWGTGGSFEIAAPRHRDRAVLEATIETGSLATSGNSERGIEINGVRYSHILDPKCGMPAPDFGSLTVWAPDAMAADCLSTALYVLGPDKALAWAAGRPGIEALAIEETAEGLRVRATAGFEGRLTALDRDIGVTLIRGEE